MIGAFEVILIIGIIVSLYVKVFNTAKKKAMSRNADDISEKARRLIRRRGQVLYRYEEEAKPTNKPVSSNSSQMRRNVTMTGQTVSGTDNTQRSVVDIKSENKPADNSELRNIVNDFDLKKAIIYKEILEPKFKEY